MVTIEAAQTPHELFSVGTMPHLPCPHKTQARLAVVHVPEVGRPSAVRVSSAPHSAGND